MKTVKMFPGYRSKVVESPPYHLHQCGGGVLSAGKKARAGKGKFTSLFHPLFGQKASCQPGLRSVPHCHWQFLYPFLQAMSFVVWKTVTVSPRCHCKGQKGRESNGSVGLSRMELRVPVSVLETEESDHRQMRKHATGILKKGFCLP